MSQPSSRLAAALADRYRIERELGQGGMATVYLAHDLKHDRKVAIKVLRPELAAIIGAERFLREIKTIATLQHPHILGLIDSGEVNGTAYYVMPFVEGESLRDRLTREKQLPIADAVRIATEVASALDYAHRHQVIHRDIKPENILLHDGSALVADFGIALAASKAGGTRMTETGMSLGTPTYMSPEQAMGEREITARSDVYALGCVTYEMLIGEPPFTGPTAQAIVAKVMTAEPARPTDLRKTVPWHVAAATLTALAKLPADRFASAHDFAEALADQAFAGPAAGTSARLALMRAPGLRSRLRDPLVLGLAAATLASLGLAVALWRRPAAPPALPPVRFSFGGTDSAPVFNRFPWPAAISPDGGTLVYAVPERGGGTSYYSRRSDQLAGRPIPGTTGGSQPLFSPDGQWLAFEADNKEKKVRLDGSAPVTIAEGGGNNGADWTTSGELVVGSTGGAHGLSHVSIAGGELVQLTRPDSARGESDHLWPIALPDGRTIVFTLWSGALATAELAMTSLDDGKVSRLELKGIRPLAVLDGALVYVQADGAVMAVPLDASRRRARGRPVPVLDPVPVEPANNGNSAIFVSPGGALVVGSGIRRSRLSWISRDGTAHPISPETRGFLLPRLSPDGRRIAVMVGDGSRSDVWIYDLQTGTLSRLTTVGSATSVEWTRDGTGVVYSAAGTESRASIWAQSVEAASAPERLAQLPRLSPYADPSPDRRWLLVQSLGEQDWDVLRVSLDSSHAVAVFSGSSVTDWGPRFSPDGRWAAVVTSESGAFEVYVRSFPDPTVKVQVSVGGGEGPVWSADGTRLYYLSGRAIIEARLATTPVMRVLSRDTAFTRLGTELSSDFGTANFDVTRDGSRLIAPVSASEAYQLIVVPNWLTEFRQRFAASRN
jgi:eukaryotic-like serine/threonine-protein kinase